MFVKTDFDKVRHPSSLFPRSNISCSGEMRTSVCRFAMHAYLEILSDKICSEEGEASMPGDDLDMSGMGGMPGMPGMPGMGGMGGMPGMGGAGGMPDLSALGGQGGAGGSSLLPPVNF